MVQKGIRWSIGNGEDVNFWKDEWLDDIPLTLLVSNPVDETVKVKTFVQDGLWNVLHLQNSLPQDTDSKFRAYPLPLDSTIKDELLWPFDH